MLVIPVSFIALHLHPKNVNSKDEQKPSQIMNYNWMKNSYWFDGKAEINFYQAKITKYGIPREAKEIVNSDEQSSFHYNTYWDGQGRGKFDVNFPKDLILYDALPVQLRIFNLEENLNIQLSMLPSQLSSKVQYPEVGSAHVRKINSEKIIHF